MEKKTLKEIKKGEMFTLKPIEEPKASQVYIKDDYDRTDKKWACYKWSDINAYRYLKGSTPVYTDFTF